MDKVKRFFELKELWKKSSESERAGVDSQLSDLMDSMNDAEHKLLVHEVSEDFKRMRQEARDIRITVTARELLKPILPYVSVTALAKEYFGKSASWFYQRLNGNLVHGKAAAFTDAELNTLADALKDVAGKLNKAASAFLL